METTLLTNAPHRRLEAGTKCSISIGHGHRLDVTIEDWSPHGLTVQLTDINNMTRITFYPWHTINAVSVSARDEDPQ